MFKQVVFGLTVGILLSVVGSRTGFAQTTDWPRRPIHIVVQVPPGGGFDTITRLYADPLSKKLGQSVIIDNITGASGVIAAQNVIRSNPDGYTALVVSSIDVTAQLTAKTPVYDLVQDTRSVSLLVQYPYVLVTHKDSGFKTIPDLITMAKAKPGDITYGSAGVGSGNHILTEDLALKAGIKLNHVPYRGNVPALNDLMAGQIALLADGVPPELALIRGGTVQAVAVTSAQRWPDLPDVPAVAETIPGFDYTTFVGLVVPAKTPEAIVEKFAAVTKEALADPDVNKKLVDMGAKVTPTTPAEMAKYIEGQFDMVAPVVTKLNIKRDN